MIGYIINHFVLMIANTYILIMFTRSLRVKFPILFAKIKWKLILYFIFFTVILTARFCLGIMITTTYNQSIDIVLGVSLTIVLFSSEILPSFLLVGSYLVLKSNNDEANQLVESRLSETFIDDTASIKDSDVFERTNKHHKFIIQRDSRINKSTAIARSTVSEEGSSTESRYLTVFSAKRADDKDEPLDTGDQPERSESFSNERGGKSDDLEVETRLEETKQPAKGNTFGR